MNSEQKREYLESDPPLELRGSAAYSTNGFKIKHDSGNTKVWGNYDTERQTEWAVLSGPIIGFHFQYPVVYTNVGGFEGGDLTLIVGDRCRPKYFGARKLFLRLGERREVKFFWQISDAEYFTTCLSKGFFYLYNPEQLKWV